MSGEGPRSLSAAAGHAREQRGYPTASRLAVSILTHSSADRLTRLVAQARACTAEVVIGVDAASTDGTFELAARLADVTFRFESTGTAVPARLLPLDYARADWILSLDDDELLDEGMPAVLRELVGQKTYTHFWFLRRWLPVPRPPWRYLAAVPYHPDWQLRLFRNDRGLVARPRELHAGFRVLGTGGFEDRAGILHLPGLAATAFRDRKHDTYRAAGDTTVDELLFCERSPAPRVALERPPLDAPAAQPPDEPRVVESVVPVPEPPWRAELRVQMARTAVAGELVAVEVFARNVGGLTWVPPRTPYAVAWPHLSLAHHLRGADGTLLAHGASRAPMPRVVAHGEEVRIRTTLVAPQQPGQYLVEWDLVSELECWFADCGSPVARAALEVIRTEDRDRVGAGLGPSPLPLPAAPACPALPSSRR